MKRRKKKIKKIEKKRKNEEEKKTKSELAREKKLEAIQCIGKEAPYPLVPSKRNKE